MAGDRTLPDPPLSAEQRRKATTLTAAQLDAIDEALLRQVADDWRKIARVVGFAMGEPIVRAHGLPDVFYADRVRYLIDAGRLEAQSDVRAMGLGEVRLPTGSARAT